MEQRTKIRDAETLLDQLTTSSIDDDYYTTRDRPPGKVSMALTAVTICLFGALLATAAAQTRNDRPETELERRAMIEGVETRQEIRTSRQATVESLREEIVILEGQSPVENPARDALFLSAGEIAATGPGITVTARSGDGSRDGDRITDTDMQLLVNGLWYAGAEAISVNGHRIVSTTAIRTAGETLTINFQSVGEPYIVKAIGDREELEERLIANPTGRHWAQRSSDAGIQFEIELREDLVVPAGPPRRLRLSYAESSEGTS